MTNIIDNSSPEAIGAAIRKVNQTPELADRAGIEALWHAVTRRGHPPPSRAGAQGEGQDAVSDRR
jgi:hypothetical protein